eukprot:UN12866
MISLWHLILLMNKNGILNFNKSSTTRARKLKGSKSWEKAKPEIAEVDVDYNLFHIIHIEDVHVKLTIKEVLWRWSPENLVIQIDSFKKSKKLWAWFEFADKLKKP